MLSTRRKLPVSRMWNSSFNLTLTCAICLGLATSVFSARLPELFLPNLVILIVLCICLLILWITKKRSSEVLPTGIFISSVLLVIAVVYMNHEVYVRQNLHFMPFIGIKLLCLALALTAPPKRWLGWSSLALCGLVPMFQYYSWAPELKARLPIQEPWITLIGAICGLFLYAHRCRVYEFLRKEEQAEALRRYAHLLLASQHLLNTQLQAIELCTSLITKDEVDRKLALETVMRAMSTIRHLNSLLSFGETSISWDDLKLPGSIEEFERNVTEFKSEMKSPQA